MSAEFDFAADITIRGRHVSDRQRCDFANSQSRKNGKRKCETISLAVTGGFNDPKPTV
jgi:hypothetical protein